MHALAPHMERSKLWLRQRKRCLTNVNLQLPNMPILRAPTTHLGLPSQWILRYHKREVMVLQVWGCFH
jgi:hypothetical protein